MNSRYLKSKSYGLSPSAFLCIHSTPSKLPGLPLTPDSFFQTSSSHTSPPTAGEGPEKARLSVKQCESCSAVCNHADEPIPCYGPSPQGKPPAPALPPGPAAGFFCTGRGLNPVRDRARQDGEQPGHTPLATFVLHLGYSWSPGSTLKEMGTRSALRLAQKASHTARCTALYTTSKPVRVTKAMGRQHSSTGKSHCVGVILHPGRRPASRQEGGSQRRAFAAQAGCSSPAAGAPRRALTRCRARPPRDAAHRRGLERGTGQRQPGADAGHGRRRGQGEGGPPPQEASAGNRKSSRNGQSVPRLHAGPVRKRSLEYVTGEGASKLKKEERHDWQSWPMERQGAVTTGRRDQ